MTKPKHITQKLFWNPVLIALAEAANFKAREVVYFKPLDPRALEIGPEGKPIAEDEYGLVTGKKRLWTHQLIGLAFAALRTAGHTDSEDKGRWFLTEEGVAYAKKLMSDQGIDMPEEAVETETDSTEETDTDTAAIEYIDIRAPEVAARYSENAYFNDLASANTKCFGLYSHKANACKKCPLASDCAVKVREQYSVISATLMKERAEKARAEARRRKKKKTDDLVGELNQATTASKTKKGAGDNPKWDRSKALQLRARANSKCRACGKSITQGSQSMWIEDEGTFHPDCL